jgi:hypothetical protein
MANKYAIIIIIYVKSQISFKLLLGFIKGNLEIKILIIIYIPLLL